MTNIEIISAKKAISDYVGGLPFPSEIKRMIVKEVYEDIQKIAYSDSIKEAEAAEKEEKVNGKEKL